MTQNRADEQCEDLPVGRERCQHVEAGAEDEEDEIGCLAPEVVGGRRPGDAAEDVEQRDEADEARADGGSFCYQRHVLLECRGSRARTCR